MMAAAFLVNFFFWTGLSVGGVAFAALLEVTGGEWAGPVRTASERLNRFLPASLVAFIALMWRSRDVYPWAQHRLLDPSVRPWLIASRDGLALVAVYACAFAFCRASRRAREEQAATATRSAIIFLVVYATGFGLVVVDLMMSLEPRWTSTLFPAYVLAGNVYAGVAVVALLSSWIPAQSPAALTRPQIRDIANILAGLALFWMYLFWSQFLVMWYGNMPAEVRYLTARIGGFRPAGWVVLAMCGTVPAVVLVPQWGKRIAMTRIVSFVILAGMWLERWVLIAPGVHTSGSTVPATVVALITTTAAFFATFMVSIMPIRAGARWRVGHNRAQ